MKKLLTIVALLTFLIPTYLWAEEIGLAVISSNYKKRSYNLALVVDGKNLIQEIITKKNNNNNKVKRYKTDVLDKPITLVKMIGITLVSLRCYDFNPKTGCKIDIEYPYNIILGDFDHFEAELKYQNKQWNLYTKNKKFTQMHLKPKTILGLLVGVKRIDLK